MKKIVLTICATTVSIMAFASLFVTSKVGDVQIMRNGEWETVYVSMGLEETDLLKTGQYGKVSIDNRTNKVSYTFQSLEPKSVKDLIASYEKSVSRSLLREIFYALMNPPIEKYVPGGSAKGYEWDRQVAKALKCKQRGISDYQVNFTLLDLNTMQPITQVDEEQLVAFQIDNNSDTPLFVNIIDRDEQGIDTAIFPTTNLQELLELYIPANSSIRLTTYPYIINFAPANTTDRLTLVAYPLPFNMSNVIKLMEETDCSQGEIPNKPIGIYKTSVRITNS